MYGTQSGGGQRPWMKHRIEKARGNGQGPRGKGAMGERTEPGGKRRVWGNGQGPQGKGGTWQRIGPAGKRRARGPRMGHRL